MMQQQHPLIYIITNWEQYRNYLRSKERKKQSFVSSSYTTTLVFTKDSFRRVNQCSGRRTICRLVLCSQLNVHQSLSCFAHIARPYYSVFFSITCDHVAGFFTIQLEKVRYGISIESAPCFFSLCENWKLLEGLM